MCDTERGKEKERGSEQVSKYGRERAGVCLRQRE